MKDIENLQLSLMVLTKLVKELKSKLNDETISFNSKLEDIVTDTNARIEKTIEKVAVEHDIDNKKLETSINTTQDNINNKISQYNDSFMGNLSAIRQELDTKIGNNTQKIETLLTEAKTSLKTSDIDNITKDLVSKDDISKEIKRLEKEIKGIENKIKANKDGVNGQDGKDGRDGKDGKDAAEPIFKVLPTETIPNTEEASVELTKDNGTYYFKFKVPKGGTMRFGTGGGTDKTKLSEFENDTNFITISDIPAIPSKHSDLDDLNGDSNYQHLTAEEKAQFGKIIHFGTCTTASATVAKEVTIAGYTPSLGDIICITYTLGSTASAPTLSINGGSAINIQLNGINANTTVHTIVANAEVKYCYDGTYWQMFGSQRTSDSNSMELDYMGVACKVGAETTRWKILMQGTDDRFYPLTIGNATTTDKTISTAEFKIGGLVVWYATTATLAAGSSSLTMYTEYNSANFTYAINKAAYSLTANTNMYLKGTINSSGNFVLDNTTTTSAFVEVLPTTDDGFVYMFLGYSYSNNAFKLMQQHPIYWYKDGELRPYGNEEYLKLDQTIPQTVENGMPIFDGGLKVNGGSLQYFINLSPVAHNTTNYYIPEDAAVVFYFSPTSDVQLVFDDGSPKSPINITGMSVTQPTIYMYLVSAFGGFAQVTCYSDLNETDFLAFIKILTEDPDTVIDYHETAFTYADGVYTNVTTKPVCQPSVGTTWTNPSAITADCVGFMVNPTTSNVQHVGNYTNNVTTSIMKTKGQFKAGNGNLIDLVTCPITSNPILDLSGGGYLQFAMTFVPEIISTGTVDDPITRTVHASGVYGTTAFEGGYATYSGTALGMWSAVQNAVSGPTTLQEGVGVRAGMTYSSESNQEMYIRNMICFQSDFTNLNNGTSKHDNIKHYEVKHLSNNVNSCTNNYGVYVADNSDKATNSWGLYSLDQSNYAKKMYIGATPTKPTETLEVEGNAKISDGIILKSPDNTLYKVTVANDGTLVVTAV